MIVTYIRSSSYNSWDYCKLQTFINYGLGWRQDSGHKANKGTATHKMLECLANCKLAIQNGKNYIDDEILGKFEFEPKHLLKPRQLSIDEIDAINKTRINKNTYKTDCSIDYGHIRYGEEIANHIGETVYEHYKKYNSHNDWKPIDKKDCINWMWIALENKGGLYDPRRKDIYSIEQNFDIPINKPWANFEFTDQNGKKVVGTLAIKGTIDLIVRDSDLNLLEIIDWKTGQRLNWATGERKEYNDLCKDPQLMLYHYAAKNLFPEFDVITTSIVFIRDGGPFSIIFEDEHLELMESLLEERFKEMTECELPDMLDPKQKDFRCQKLCDYYKNDWRGTGCNMCKFIHTELKDKGMDEVVRLYSNKDHDINKYHAPGAVNDTVN